MLPLTQLTTRFFPAALQLGLAPGTLGEGCHRLDTNQNPNHSHSECLWIWEVWYPGSTVSRSSRKHGLKLQESLSTWPLQIDPLPIISISHERPGNSCNRACNLFPLPAIDSFMNFLVVSNVFSGFPWVPCNGYCHWKMKRMAKRRPQHSIFLYHVVVLPVAQGVVLIWYLYHESIHDSRKRELCGAMKHTQCWTMMRFFVSSQLKSTSKKVLLHKSPSFWARLSAKFIINLPQRHQPPLWNLMARPSCQQYQWRWRYPKSPPHQCIPECQGGHSLDFEQGAQVSTYAKKINITLEEKKSRPQALLICE